MANVVPADLTKEQIYRFLKQILTVPAEKLEVFKDVIEEQDINGRYLLDIMEDDNKEYLNKTKEALKLNLKEQLSFDKLMKQMKERQKEVEKSNSKGLIQELPNQSTAGEAKFSKVQQTISKADCIIGGVYNKADEQTNNTGSTINYRNN